MAFNYDWPSSVVVGTQSGKLFFKKDPTAFLPSVPIPIRSVAIDCEATMWGLASVSAAGSSLFDELEGIFLLLTSFVASADRIR
jgi:hypothetical protein